MPTSHACVFLHFVWTTKGRMPWITPERERNLHRIIQANVRKKNCVVLGVNGTANHVHLLVKLDREVSMSDLMNQVKGASSRYMNAQNKREGIDAEFDWRPGYGVFSIGRNQVDRVVAYISNQKEHHAANKTWPDWEVDE